jgi:D-3-phosphoglycerate dehydrogenase
VTYRVAIGPSSFGDEDDTPLRMLTEAGVEVVPNVWKRRLTESEIIAHLDGIDGLIAGLEPLNKTVMTSARPRLRVIARVGIGMDNVDLAAAQELGIAVSNTPDEPARAVAEMTLTALLALGRQLVPTNAALHAGEWKKSIGVGLGGSKLLIVGYGRIGRRVADLARAFGAEILVVDPYLGGEDFQHGERQMSLADGLAEADAISLHAGGAEKVLGEDQFAAMKDGVVLLNSARAQLVDEDALVAALESGKVRGAWFDVFWQEPYQGRLLGFEQVLLTPHVATYTRQCRLSMETAATRNLLRDLGIAE